MRDWHPATRDNYLAAFAAFEQWHIANIGPLQERVDGHAILLYGQHLLSRPSKRSPNSKLTVPTVKGYLSAVRTALKRARISVGDDGGLTDDLLGT